MISEIAYSSVETITSGVIAFFLLLAIVTLVRIVLRREDSAWRGLRIGFFVERDRRDPGVSERDHYRKENVP